MSRKEGGVVRRRRQARAGIKGRQGQPSHSVLGFGGGSGSIVCVFVWKGVGRADHRQAWGRVDA